jgi:hypothetical protein
MVVDFFAIGRAYTATPEKKHTPSDAETPEKCVRDVSDHDDDPLDGEEPCSESAADEEGQPLHGKQHEQKKEKKKKKKKKKKKNKEKNEKKHQKKKNQKWQQGRDKIPEGVPQLRKNAILQASFKNNMPAWRKEYPQLKSIIETTQEVAGVRFFQLGCAECMAYVEAHPDEKIRQKKKTGNKLAIGEFGQTGIRKHDLLRHFGGPRSKLHQNAVAWKSEKVSEKKQEDAREDVPSAAQFRIAYSMLKENPLAATGKMYEKACREAREGGDKNVPPYRCSNPIFGKIARSVGQAVVYDLHRRLGSKNKNAPQWATLAEDNGGGISQKCLRVAFKDFSALDVLLDWSRHLGKKKAL